MDVRAVCNIASLKKDRADRPEKVKAKKGTQLRALKPVSHQSQGSCWLSPKFPFQNIKAGYMATPVACAWAGAIFEVTRPFFHQE